MNGNQTTAGNGGLVNQYQGGSGQFSTAVSTRDTVQQALDEQEKQVSELHGALNAFADRLMVVLAAEPANKIADSSPAPNSINVIERVRRHSSAIHGAASRLQDLMQRLQL